VGTFRAQNLQATIVDNVLHITFDVRYSEIKIERFVKMQSQSTNEHMKE
jgi:FAD synthase